jgi:hypothetical protein
VNEGSSGAGAQAAGAERPGNGGGGTDAAAEARRKAAAARVTGRAWGNLPPRLRDKVVTGADERSHPDYQRLVDEFYSRLAKQAEE